MDAWEDDNFFFLGFWPICRSKTGWQIWQVDREVWNFSGSLCFDFMLKHFSWMPLFNLDGINCCIFQIPSKNSETAIHDPLEQKKQSNRLDTSWYTSHRQQGRKLLSCVLFLSIYNKSSVMLDTLQHGELTKSRRHVYFAPEVEVVFSPKVFVSLNTFRRRRMLQISKKKSSPECFVIFFWCFQHIISVPCEHLNKLALGASQVCQQFSDFNPQPSHTPMKQMDDLKKRVKNWTLPL